MQLGLSRETIRASPHPTPRFCSKRRRRRREKEKKNKPLLCFFVSSFMRELVLTVSGVSMIHFLILFLYCFGLTGSCIGYFERR